MPSVRKKSHRIKNSNLLLFLCMLFLITCSCKRYKNDDNEPKLILGIVVDQMRNEYLYRFKDNYGDKGFKRLMKDGFIVKNMHINYLPSYTAPGHASVYTGTTPQNHGIVGNDWYNRKIEKPIYCAEDSTVYLVSQRENSKKKDDFARSPKNMSGTTITDELKMFTNNKSKVIGLSIKDRGAIFPAGHLGDYAFWYQGETGDFVTSSYYARKLPNWLVKFNEKELADSLLNLTWDTSLPIDNYVNSNPDDSPYELVFNGKSKPTFPYNLKELRGQNGNFDLIPKVPYGNTLLTQLALETIKREKMGQSNVTDFLAISYSSTDYVGHNFGIRSKELEDTYIRLDNDIASLLSALDDQVGENNYLVFLTADHAASDYPSFLKDNRVLASFFRPKEIRKNLNNYLGRSFGYKEYIQWIDGSKIYLYPAFRFNQDILNAVAYFFHTEVEGIKEVFVPHLVNKMFRNNINTSFFLNGYHRKNSGDVFYLFESGWMPYRPFGTTHGHTYPSDTHIPNLWYGTNIRKGESTKHHTIDQIAPTLALAIDIPFPSLSSSRVMDEVLTIVEELPRKRKRD